VMLTVASRGDNRLVVLNPFSGEVLHEFGLGMSPESVAASPDGSSLYVGGDSRVVRICLSTGASTSLREGDPLQGSAYGLSIDPSGNNIFVSGSGMRQVAVLDAQSGGACAPIYSHSESAKNHRATAFGPGGEFYLTSFSGKVNCQSWTSDFKPLFEFDKVDSAFGVGVRSDGEVVIASQDGSAYYRYQPDGKELGKVAIDAQGQIRNVAVDPWDNVWIAAKEHGVVIGFDKDNQEIKRLPFNHPTGVAFVPEPVLTKAAAHS